MLCPDPLSRGATFMPGQYHRYFRCAVVVCGCLAGQLACAQTPVQHVEPVQHVDSAAVNSGVAAVVDGHTISTDEVEKIAARRYGQDILDGLIDDFLIEREAERLHVTVSEAEIDHQVQMLAEAIKPKTLDEGLEEHHQTIAELRDDFRRRLLALKVAAVGSPPGHFVHARVILIKTGSGASAKSGDANAFAQATAIQKRLLAGAKFGELAEEYSQDPGSRMRGGDIGVLYEGCGYEPTVVHAALALKAGGIAQEPIKTDLGYYLMMVSSTDSEHPALEDKLYSDAQMRYELHQGSRILPEYLRELRAKATIQEFLKP